MRSIILRFAVASLVPMLALGLVLDSAVRDAMERRTADVYGGMTQAMFRLAQDVLIQPADLEPGAPPLPPERVAIVNQVIQGLGATDAIHIRFVNRDRRVVFGTRAGDVGTTIGPSERLAGALAGEVATRFVPAGPAAPEGTSRVIELFVPIRFDGDETVRGAIVATGINDDVLKNIDRDVRRIRTIVATVLAVLWACLLPIAGSVSRRLRRQANENRHLALHDTLTGLPNRNLLGDRLDQAIGGAFRTGELVGLLLIDLDHFKEVNDTLGHGKGDELLQRVADRLRANVRTADTVARLGGDEFAVVLAGLRDEAELRELAYRLSTSLTEPLALDGIDVVAQASIGAAIYPFHATGPEQLLQHADIAMYAAKASHDGYRLYTAEIDSHSPSRLALSAELRRALSPGADELVLHFQPVACPATGAIASMEALVRWDHPARGLLPPAEFILLAEQSGLVRTLTARVLDLAAAQMRRWMDDGLDIGIAVNLSTHDLRDMGTLELVQSTLARHRVPAWRLEVEVTETAVLANADSAVALIAALQRLSVRVALDDFGTGFSSLTYLKRLRPDRLKIDRSFVDAMAYETTDAEIVRSVIELAHSLHIGVTAEGVETERHWQLLTALACDLVQGYYLARPLPAPEATAWLHARSPLAAEFS